MITVCMLFFTISAVAQSQPTKVVADKIAGIVGDRIILQSDIKNSIADIVRQGGTVPENGECLLMEQAIISKILMLQAEKDSLPVTDDEVEADLDNRIRQYINQLGSQEALEEVAGKTIYQIKDDARESVKEQKLAAAMQRKICLLYTSDAADERSSVDLGGRRIIKKKQTTQHRENRGER